MKPFLKKIAKIGLTDRNNSLTGGIFACVYAVLVYLTTLNTKIYIQKPIVSTTIPRLICYVMFGIGVVMILRWVIALKQGTLKYSAKDIENMEKEPDINDLFVKITPYCCFILLTLYVYLMKPLGFMAASALYITVQIPLLAVDFKPKTFLKALAVGVVTAVLSYLIFSKGFGLHLPTNRLGF